MAASFEGFQPVFGEAKPESDLPPSAFHPLIFHVCTLDSSRVGIIVSDFRNHTFHGVHTVEDLEAMRDRIGLGGNWSEFMGYFLESISSDNVKLIFQGLSKPQGFTDAKLVANKARGLPLISISLNRLLDSSASDAMASLANELFKAHKSKTIEAAREQARSRLLTTSGTAEQEEADNMERQPDAAKLKRKHRQFGVPEKGLTHDDSHEKLSSQNAASRRGGRRIIPSHRRASVRGAVLQRFDDKDD